MKPKNDKRDEREALRNALVLPMMMCHKGDRMRHKGNRRPKDARKKREDYLDDETGD